MKITSTNQMDTILFTCQDKYPQSKPMKELFSPHLHIYVCMTIPKIAK